MALSPSPSTSNGTARLIYLEDDNYSEWASTARAWVRSQHAIAHIEPPAGTANPPAFTTTDANGLAAKAAWERQDDTIAGTLLMSLRPSQKAHVEDSATAATIWSTLRLAHHRVGFDSYHHYLSQLTAASYVDGTSMQAHVHNHVELRRRIAAAGLWLPDEYYCSMFIASLPDTWKIVTHVLRTVDGTARQPLPAYTPACARCTALKGQGMPESASVVSSLSWTDLTKRVLSEAHQREQAAAAIPIALSAVDTNSSAYQAGFAAATAAANRGGRSPTGAGGNKGGKAGCLHCGILGHTRAVCYKLNGYPRGHKLYNPLPVQPQQDSAGSAVIVTPPQDELYVEYADTAVGDVPGHHECALRAAPPLKDGSHHWVVDSGASTHFCNDRTLFSTFSPLVTLVKVAAGDTRRTEGRGSVPLIVGAPGGATHYVTLADVVYMPDMHDNLLSVGKLLEQCLHAAFTTAACVISTADGVTRAVAARAGGLYRLVARPPAALHSAAHAATDVDWHARFGHADSRAIMRLFTHQMADTADGGTAIASLKRALSSQAHCETCLRGKQTRAPLTGSKGGSTRATRPLEVVHMDLAGPYAHTGRDGALFLLVVVDDYTRYLWVRGLARKWQAFDSFKQYKALAETQHCAAGLRITQVRSDNGGEFVSNDFTQYLQASGIQRQLTAPYTSQQNGVAERAIRTINDAARTTLLASGLPSSFMFDAIAHAVYVRNRLPAAAQAGMTPFEAWHGRKPRVDVLRPFGCLAHVHVAEAHRNKMEARSRRCVLLGYSAESKQYRLYDPAARTIIQSRDVRFDEHLFYGSTVAEGGTVTQTISDSLPVPMTDPAPQQPSAPPAAAPNEAAADSGRRGRSAGPPSVVLIPSSLAGRREVHALQDARPWSSGSSDVPSAVHIDHATLAELGVSHGSETAELAADLLALTAAGDVPITTDPVSVEAAMATPQAAQWRAAMKAEFDALQQAQTYTLVPPPRGQRPIGAKWVLKAKRNAAGEVIKYKARLVAKGYAQRHGVDYEETYAPVCRIGSIRVLIALAAHFDWEVHHMDVTSAFLNGDLEETVYMEQVPGFEARGEQADHVCKLSKSLYGLKQAGRTWNTKIDSALRAASFIPVPADMCVYKHQKDFGFVIVSLYVDDLLLFSNSTRALASFKAQLSAQFSMTDLGEAKFILGIEITRNRRQRTIALSQPSYSRDVVSAYGMDASTATDTPTQLGVRLMTAQDTFTADPSAVRRYQSAVGALMWAAICTRPDLSYAVGQLSQHASNPDKSHFKALNVCIRYLRGTTDYRLTYKGEGRAEDVPELTGYSDADWAGDVNQRRSTTGYVFQLCGGAVSWQSKRQRTIAQSTVEAEYMAAASGAKEAIWLRSLLTGVGCMPSGPTILRVDNEGAIALADNPRHHDLTKHIAVRYHLIREHVADSTITLIHVPTELQAADGLTKGLSREKHISSVRLLGLA
jgi:transposase InsO family protein